jgi:glycosyltransferase involved in cell wall biosynthesis
MMNQDGKNARPIKPVPIKPVVTILTPVFNEALNLDKYAATISSLFLAREDIDYRVMLVDDGSTDDSWIRMTALCQRNSAFTAIRLSRNFGSHTALCAAIDRAEGDALVILACDLQDPAETVLEFVEEWKKGRQIVWGARRSRPEGHFRRYSVQLFQSLLRRHAMPRNSLFTTGSFLLMDRQVADCLRQFREHNRITFALVAWTGFDQSIIYYDRKAREKGVSGWTFGKTLKTIYDAFIGFSPLPARVMTLAGVVMSLFSMLFVIYLVLLAYDRTVLRGWTSIMALISFMFGMLFIMLGVVCEYLYRIFLESTRRPLYFISKTAGAELLQSDGSGQVPQ